MSPRNSIESDTSHTMDASNSSPGDTSPRASLLSLRIRFRDDARLGPGKIALLEAIARSGSIAVAAQSLDMSEKRASLLIESLTAFFGEPITLTDPGNDGVRVSALGLDLIEAFRAVESDARASFDRHFSTLAERVRKSG